MRARQAHAGFLNLLLPILLGMALLPSMVLASQATFTERATVAIEDLFPRAWSPTALRLAYSKSDGLYISDFSSGSHQSSRIFNGRVTDIAWSPDGEWIACRAQDTVQVFRGIADLVLLSRTGANNYSLLRNTDIANLEWTSSNTLATTHTNNAHPLSQHSPTPVQTSAPIPISMSQITALDTVAGVLGIQLIDEGGQPVGTIRSSRTLNWPSKAHLMVRDRFPDATRYLVGAVGARSPSLIMNSSGQILDTLAIMGSPDELIVTSISSTAQYAAGYGYQSHENEEDTGFIVLIELPSKHRLPVGGIADGSRPQLSKIGFLLAFLDRAGLLHIGEVSIQ